MSGALVGGWIFAAACTLVGIIMMASADDSGSFSDAASSVMVGVVLLIVGLVSIAISLAATAVTTAIRRSSGA